MLRKAFPSLLLITFMLLAFWQVAFMQGILRWDAVHCFLAWRHNVADNLREGALPLWSAYQHLGFPLHADPETGAWYPLVWIIGIVRGYDFYSINFEWCLHILIAGWGMYHLCRTLAYSRMIALMAAFSFMSCGVFISNAQNFIFLIGLAWSPWVFAYFRMAVVHLNYRSAVACAFFLFLTITGSYPGITIIVFYSLAVYALYYFFTRRKELSEKHLFTRACKVLGVMAMFTLGLSAVSLVSIAEFLPHVTRIEGLSAERILENPFSPKAFVSFLTPYAVGTMQNFDWKSDFAMINAYCGILTVALLVAWTFTPGRTKREWALLGGFVLLMLIALGPFTPLRMWVTHLPALGLFRHPSLFRFVALFALVLFAYTVLQRFEKTTSKNLLIALGIIGLLLITLAALNIPASMHAFSATADEWLMRAQPSIITVSERIFVQSIFQLLICMLLFLLVWNKKFKYLPAVVFLDMLVATQLNVPSTVVYNLPFQADQQRLAFVEEHPRPYAGQNILSISSEHDTLELASFVENENIFLRQPAWDGYNSYILSGYDSLEHDKDFPAITDHPLIYSKDGVMLSNIQLVPNEISATIDAGAAGTAILQQNHHPNWRCEIDGKTVDISVINHTMMQVQVPAESRSIVFRYSSLKTQIALFITCIFILLTLAVLLRRNGFSKPASTEKGL